MKKIIILLLCSLLSFSLLACAGKSDITASNSAKNDMRIKLTIGSKQVFVKLHDNPTSRDLLTLLPLKLTFKEYAGKEKISYLPRKLSVQENSSINYNADDFTYFAPWGNLAIFYKGKEKGGNGLVILGTIESGKDIFADLTSDFTATLEKVN